MTPLGNAAAPLAQVELSWDTCRGNELVDCWIAIPNEVHELGGERADEKEVGQNQCNGSTGVASIHRRRQGYLGDRSNQHSLGGD